MYSDTDIRIAKGDLLESLPFDEPSDEVFLKRLNNYRKGLELGVNRSWLEKLVLALQLIKEQAESRGNDVRLSRIPLVETAVKTVLNPKKKK